LAALPDRPLPQDIVWLDLLNGTPEEVAAVEGATGLTLPTVASLREIEHSSRMRRDDAAVYLSLPLAQAGTQGTTLSSVGFVLTADLLVTIRFAADPAFDQFVAGFRNGRPADPSAPSILIGLFETVTDAIADRLEETGDGLDALAARIFGSNKLAAGGRHSPKLKNVALRQLMREVGRTGQIIGKLRASLLTAGRIVPYVESEARPWFKEGTAPRIVTLRADIASLDEYESHLSDKVQFLLDAALGLINMEQNDTFKVLTIASVVGIPPTLVASLYGMNFHNMPELSWTWGYPYGLSAIALSAAIPLAWFKYKGWF
jgi:magnesium transporter